MSPPGTDAGRDRPFDQDLAKALSHPVRQRILERLSGGGVASPKELARALGEPLGNVAYHVRILERLGFLELVRTRQRRGALEHHYRALADARLDAERWAELPPAFRRLAVARTLRDLVSTASDAGVAGGFEHPDAQIRRVRLELDEDGWNDVAQLLEQTFTRLRELEAESTHRAAERQPGAPLIVTELAMLLFRDSP